MGARPHPRRAAGPTRSMWSTVTATRARSRPASSVRMLMVGELRRGGSPPHPHPVDRDRASARGLGAEHREITITGRPPVLPPRAARATHRRRAGASLASGWPPLKRPPMTKPTRRGRLALPQVAAAARWEADGTLDGGDPSREQIRTRLASNTLGVTAAGHPSGGASLGPPQGDRRRDRLTGRWRVARTALTGGGQYSQGSRRSLYSTLAISFSKLAACATSSEGGSFFSPSRASASLVK